MTGSARGTLTIAGSFLVAAVLTFLPVPEWAAVWRPSWVALVLIYWCMDAPNRCGVVVGWCMGLLLDVMLGSLLGQHALGLSVVAFLALKLRQQVRVMPLWQQAVSVFGLVFLHRALVLWINGIQGMPVMAYAYWSSPLISMLLWPWVFIVLRDVRRKFGVA